MSNGVWQDLKRNQVCMQAGPWQHRGYPARPPPGHEVPNRNNTLHTTWALMLLQTEFAMGLLAKTPGFVLEEQLLCHSSECWARERLCLGGHLLAAREEMLGEMGAEGGSEAGPKERGEGIVKVPLIPNLQQLSLYLTIYKDNILLSFQRLIIFCLLGCSAMGRADADANIAGKKMYCKCIWK